jgi:hypothetical protein
MTIKQGTILPTTGIGVGYLILFIYVLFAWNIGFYELLKIPLSFSAPIIFCLMQFSYKDFILDATKPEQFQYRYRLLFVFPIYVTHKFIDYNPYVLRVINKSYNVKQGGGKGLIVNEGTYAEAYLAIIGRSIKTKENYEICKGTKEQLDQLIKNNIQSLSIPVYLGAPKKGYEYYLD